MPSTGCEPLPREMSKDERPIKLRWDIEVDKSDEEFGDIGIGLPE